MCYSIELSMKRITGCAKEQKVCAKCCSRVDQILGRYLDLADCLSSTNARYWFP